MATIQKRKNKNGTHSYRVMIRQSDGFPPGYKTFPTRQEAKEWAQEEEARRRQGNCFNPQKAKQTLGDLTDRYITIILPTKPKNARDVKRQLEWWKGKLGKHALQTITPDLIAKYRLELSEGLTSKGTLRSNSTVNRYLATLSSALSYAVRECGWLTDNPCLRVTKFKEAKGRNRIASPEECHRILEACDQSRNKHLRTIVLLARTTGMRQSEITGLTWGCIDLSNETINLTETKNNRPRTVSLIGEPLALLREQYLKRSIHTPFVFPSRKRFGCISIRKAWDEALKRANVDDLRFHDLRHTYCTYAAKAGASNLELATAMGHRTLQMLQRYTHLDAITTKKLSLSVSAQLLTGEKAECKRNHA